MCCNFLGVSHQSFFSAPTFLFSAARFPGPPRPTGGPPTAGAAGAADEKRGGEVANPPGIFSRFLVRQKKKVPKNYHIPSSKLTWQWNIPIFNREYIFNWSIFQCHVSLPEGTKNYHKKGVSKNRGFSTQIMNFKRLFHYKPSIFGYPYFGNTQIKLSKLYNFI